MKRWRAVCVLLLCLGPGAAAEPILIERFLAPPELTGVTISPNGSFLAGIEPADDEQAVLIIDLATMGAQRVRFSDPKEVTFRLWGDGEHQAEWLWWGRGERRLQRVWWANDDRLIASVGLMGGHLSYLVFFGRDGSQRVKVPHRNLRAGLYHESDDLLSRLPGDTGHVLAEFPRTRRHENVGSEVRRVALDDGDSKVVERAHSRVVRWFADPSGRVRAGYGIRKGEGFLLYRDGDEGRFEEIETLSGVRFDPEQLIVLGVGPGRELYVASRHEGDRFAVYLYEMGERGFVGPIFAHPRVDVAGPLVKDWNEVLIGVRYVDEFPRIHWVDDGWIARQARVDAQLPGRHNVIESWSRDESRLVVRSESDRDPVRWFLFEEPEGRLRAVTREHPLPSDERLATTPVRIPSRTGVELPGYLTLPAGADAAPLPFVVEALGGGFGRADGGFEAGAQLLASRGYGVLRFHTRGASGFGRRFERAGRGQWPAAALADVEDAVQWLVESGRADPKRICSYGFGGYPGYVALMALAQMPERFRCAATYGAITDLEAFASHVDWRSDDYLWRRRLGEKGGADLRAASPIAGVKAFKKPVLSARGLMDRSVLPEQSRDFAAALERAGKPVTVVVLRNDGANLNRHEGQVEFFEALIGFFDAELAPPAEVQPGP